MNQYRSDDELLAQLKEAFLTPSASPDVTARLRLLDALATDNLVSIDASASRSTRLRRRFGSHASALTLSAVGVLALGGVAAAAVATNTLPGPTRTIAYDLGLPVTSPALFHARAHLHQLNTANEMHQKNTARSLSRKLIGDLKSLNQSDLSQIRSAAHNALEVSGLLSQATNILGTSAATTPTVAPSTSTSTSTSTTTTTLVPLTVPGVGSISGVTGSTSPSGVLNNATSTITSLLP